MISPASALTSALDTLARFEALGIAVFPGVYGQKGTFVKGWTTMPAAEAWALTREELRRRGRINLAARTGFGTDGFFYLVLDGDRNNPEQRLPLLRETFGDALVAVIRTGPLHDGSGLRGLHAWLRQKEPVLTATTPGGEVLGVDKKGRGHLANVPPSRHPAGIIYDWIIPWTV